jgi:hypothetical protein
MGMRAGLWATVYLVLALLSFWSGRGRVMVIPFVFMFVLALLFRSARRSAEREDAEET